MRRTIGLISAALLLAAGGCDPKVAGEDLDGDREEGKAEDPGDGGGNFPDPVMSQCGSLPDGVEAIDELASAHIVIDTGNPQAGWRVRVGSLDFECDQNLHEEPPCWGNGWAYGFSIPGDMSSPGVHQLGQAPDLQWDVAFHESDGEGCAGGVGGGGAGGGPMPDFGGQLEIFSVEDGCVIGEIRNVDLGINEPQINVNGGFVAKMCETDCVPGFDGCL